MEKVRFGKTGLMVSKIGFGALPIQRLNMADAAKVIRGAIDCGINLIDTAHSYTDSEEKIGLAIKDVPRDSIVLTTKTEAKDKKTFLTDLDESLERLGTDYIDILQHHGIGMFAPDDYEIIMGEGGAYEGMLEAIRAGKVRFPAFSSHSIPEAIRVMRDGKFDAVQLPFNFVKDEARIEAIPLAKEMDIGFIAMKPLGGGMLDDAGLCIRYLLQFHNVVPDPGIEKLSELEELVRIVDSGEKFSEADAAAVETIKAELSTTWCHRCDYCQPCPQKIQIGSVLSVESFFKRMPFTRVSRMLAESIKNARDCLECRDCTTRCPYKLDIPVLLKEKVAYWDRQLAEMDK